MTTRVPSQVDTCGSVRWDPKYKATVFLQPIILKKRKSFDQLKITFSLMPLWCCLLNKKAICVTKVPSDSFRRP